MSRLPCKVSLQTQCSKNGCGVRDPARASEVGAIGLCSVPGEQATETNAFPTTCDMRVPKGIDLKNGPQSRWRDLLLDSDLRSQPTRNTHRGGVVDERILSRINASKSTGPAESPSATSSRPLKRSLIFVPALPKFRNVPHAFGSPQKLHLRLPVFTSSLVEFPNHPSNNRQQGIDFFLPTCSLPC